MKNFNLSVFIFISIALITSCSDSDNKKTITLQPGGMEGKDAVISKLAPENNYGNLEDIHLYAWTQSGDLNITRVAIDFDLSAIPSSAVIKEAALSLFFNNTSVYGKEHSGENSFVIQRIVSDWNESAITWNNKPIAATQNQVFVDGAVTETSDFTNLDVTNLVQDMVNNKGNSNGFLLKLSSEQPYKILLLASSDNPDESIRPKLDITYTTD